MERIPPELIGRAIQEPDFRERLLADPAATAEAAGFQLDRAQIEALSSLDPDDVDRAVAALTDDLELAKYG